MQAPRQTRRTNDQLLPDFSKLSLRTLPDDVFDKIIGENLPGGPDVCKSDTPNIFKTDKNLAARMQTLAYWKHIMRRAGFDTELQLRVYNEKENSILEWSNDDVQRWKNYVLYWCGQLSNSCHLLHEDEEFGYTNMAIIGSVMKRDAIARVLDASYLYAWQYGPIRSWKLDSCTSITYLSDPQVGITMGWDNSEVWGIPQSFYERYFFETLMQWDTTNIEELRLRVNTDNVLSQEEIDRLVNSTELPLVYQPDSTIPVGVTTWDIFLAGFDKNPSHLKNLKRLYIEMPEHNTTDTTKLSAARARGALPKLVGVHYGSYNAGSAAITLPQEEDPLTEGEYEYETDD